MSETAVATREVALDYDYETGSYRGQVNGDDIDLRQTDEGWVLTRTTCSPDLKILWERIQA